MEVVPVAQECKVCNKRENIGFNYGVLSCGACKMFFHRVIFSKNIEKSCKFQGNCIKKCRFCRFQKCIKSGMMYTPTENLNNLAHQDQLSALIFNLGYLADHRNELLSGFHFFGDPSISELARDIRNIKMEPRPPDFPMNIMEWGYISGLISIDYISKFPFITALTLEDRTIVYRHCYFYNSLLSDSFRATNLKQDYICFPDGTDVVKLDAPGITKCFETKLRSRLAGRVNELKVTKEEVLLLSVVLVCNPALPNLSPAAKALLTINQKIYSSALLQHCLLTHQHNGPARFTDLLSLFHVIAKTRQDISHHFVICQFYEPVTSFKRIFWAH